jgi:hypothetical protein
MRAVASYIAGIVTILMILASGGAWTTTSEPRLQPMQLSARQAVLPFSNDLPPVPEPLEPSPLPPGCRLVSPGATCAITVVAGGLSVPVDSYDLLPESAAGTADWRSLVSVYFEPHHVDRALRVIGCESGGRPDAKNPISTASGLFQHLGSLWPARAASAGWAGSDVFDPVANVAVAAWLVYDGGGWSHWTASAGCWRR